jgi:hypothetical protein
MLVRRTIVTLPLSRVRERAGVRAVADVLGAQVDRSMEPSPSPLPHAGEGKAAPRRPNTHRDPLPRAVTFG